MYMCGGLASHTGTLGPTYKLKMDEMVIKGKYFCCPRAVGQGIFTRPYLDGCLTILWFSTTTSGGCVREVPDALHL